MLPKQFSKMFSITSPQDLKMANNIWKMLDDMSSSDPDAYEKFVEKNLKEGIQDGKIEKQNREKKYRVTVQEWGVLQMGGTIQEEEIGVPEGDNKELREKLDISGNKEKWKEVKNRFPQKVKIYLNICHSDRVKMPILKDSKQPTKNFNLSMIKQIQNLYYSLQGPQFLDQQIEQLKAAQKLSQSKPHSQPSIPSLSTQPLKPQPIQKLMPQTLIYTLIFPTAFLQPFIQPPPTNLRILLGLSCAYFQERIRGDRNPVLVYFMGMHQHGKNLYYTIDKPTIKIVEGKKFVGKQKEKQEYLLEKDVDTMQRDLDKKSQKDKPKQNHQPPTKPQILLHAPKQQQSQPQLPLLTPQAPQKKPLIQVLSQTTTESPSQSEPTSCTSTSSSIPYKMAQNQSGYKIQFLIPGVKSIGELDLQVSKDAVKLSKGNGQKVQVLLARKVDDNSVKAKLKKKVEMLQVSLNFI